MVHGIEKIREYFSDLTDRFVVIGGTACDLLFAGTGVEFRTTKDIDIVFLFHNPGPEFASRFLDFMEGGGYTNWEKSDGRPVYYRFHDPKDPAFPSMVELFAGETFFESGSVESRFKRITFSSAVSLSAILIDRNYYDLIEKGVIIAEGIPILARQYLILFKIKAFIDLSARKEKGEHVDSRDIKKHCNDVFRLSQYLADTDMIEIPPQVAEEVKSFIVSIKADSSINPKSIGLDISREGILKILKTVYNMSD